MFGLSKTEKKEPKICAIVAAAGSGTRMQIEKSKLFVEVLDKPVIAYSLIALQNAKLVDEIIVVARPYEMLLIYDIAREFGITKVTNVVTGGDTRTESISRGLAEANGDYIAIHDGARPCISSYDIDHVIEVAIQNNAATLGVPCVDTLKLVENGAISATIDRSLVWAIQTPQVFCIDIIKNAYDYARKNHITATDDCGLTELIGTKVSVVEATSSNIKITKLDDLLIAEAILKERIEELQ